MKQTEKEGKIRKENVRDSDTFKGKHLVGL